MTRRLVHRGPDAHGIWVDPSRRCVLGHRRLSIIDTSDAGLQPMVSGDERYVVAFNGEIYNYLELRPKLEASGCIFKGRTDTEVLLHAFAYWGTEAFARFDGMFAAAIFDTLTGDLVLVRDPFGEKPLYLAHLDGGGVAFASELQSLEDVPGFDNSVDVTAAAQVLTMQYVDAPRSIYVGAAKLVPGSWLRLRSDGSRDDARYFRFNPGQTGLSHRGLPDLADELEEILVRSLSRRLIADVPLGAFLSGGVDSSTVCALVRRRLGRPLETFSMGFDGAAESEHRIARALAEHLGCNHREQVLAPDVGAFFDDVGSILDEPNGDSSCLPTYLLSRFARKHVTVALSGDGGDEMFGGYGRYFALLAARADPAPGWRPGRSYYGDCVLVAHETLVDDVFGYLPDAFAAHLEELRRQLDASGAGLLGAMRRTDVEHYMPGAVLPKVDRMSMRSSLEVRTPFLNVELARFAERLPDSLLANGTRGKLILREVAYRYLPPAIMDLPKQGFGLPMQDWSRATLLDVGKRLLLDDECRLASSFGREGVERLMRRQSTQFGAYSLWGVLILESWLRAHPARLPDLRERKPRSTRADEMPDASAKTPRDSSSMRVLRVSTDLYLAGDRADEAHATALDTGLGGEAVFDLGNWGEMPTAEQWPASRFAALAFMRDATIIVEGDTAFRRLARNDLDRLERLGVRRLALRHDRYECGSVDIVFGTSSPAERRDELACLRRSALIDGGREIGSSCGGFSYVRHGIFSFGHVEALKDIVDRDASDEFVVFLDDEQLVPLKVLGGTLNERAGVYSIWNGELTFSSPRGTLRGDEKVWVTRLAAVGNPRALPFSWYVPNSESGIYAQAAALPAPPDRDKSARVVVCTHALSPGGAERQWVYLAEGLADRGFDVTFVTHSALDGEDAHYVPMLDAAGIRLIDATLISQNEALRTCEGLPLLDELLASAVEGRNVILRLAAVFRSIAPSAVFLQLDTPNLWGGLAALMSGVPRTIFSFRNHIPTRFSYLTNDWMLPAYRHLSGADTIRLTGNHEGANRDYAEWIGLDPAGIDFITNAIDPARFPLPSDADLARTRLGLGLGQRTALILGVGRLSEEKDLITFVDVCARVMATRPALRAIVVGMGRERAAIQARIEQHGLTGRIDLVGRRHDVNVLMRMASLLLITSRIEGTPNVALEAPLMGTPVVSTDVGAVASIVRHGVSGLLAPIGDVDALAVHVAAVLDDPEAALVMGARGRMDVLARFSKARMAADYAALVDDVCFSRDDRNELAASHG